VSRVWTQPPAPAHQTPGAAGHQGNVGRLHRRAVAVLDRRRHRTRSRPTSGDGGILHAQLGPFSPWPRLKESTGDRDAPPADHPELAARGKELAPNVHEALERCGTVKVTVWGAGFHADSVVQIRETPEAIPEPILLGETTVRNGSSSGATPSTSDSEKGSSRVRKSSGLR
jgi:hypothetical protein